MACNLSFINNSIAAMTCLIYYMFDLIALKHVYIENVKLTRGLSRSSYGRIYQTLLGETHQQIQELIRNAKWEITKIREEC